MEEPILKIMDNRRKIGKIGEELAIEFLESHGCQLMEKNFRSGRGEIDIIAIKEGLLLFVEVKTRTSLRHGSPEDKVRWYQQQKIKDTAQRYMSNCYWEGQIRFDVIMVYLDGSRVIRHFPGYFGQL